MADEQRVWVLDTSALVRFKQLISVSEQWAAFKHLEGLVTQGTIAMPRQVIAEVTEIAHPDLPGAWAPGVRRLLRHPLEPDDEFILHVMQAAGDVVDPQSDKDVADPWVCALALQLQRNSYDAVVVTEDVVDRQPIKTSLATVCRRLGIQSCSAREFLDSHGVKIRKEPGDEEDGRS